MQVISLRARFFSLYFLKKKGYREASLSVEGNHNLDGSNTITYTSLNEEN
jgi:hypothetical protein